MIGSEVDTAFKMLIETLDADIEAVRREGARAFESGHLDRVDELSNKHGQISEIRQEVAELQKKWNSFIAPSIATPRATAKRPPTFRDLYIPILQLAESRECIRSADVRRELDGWMKEMGFRYSHVDNALQYMTKDGLLIRTNPRSEKISIWQMTEKGKGHLSERRGQVAA